jgi:transposase
MRVSVRSRRYNLSFREDSLALLRRSGRSIRSVAEGLGIPMATLRYWYDADMAKKRKKKTGSPATSSAHDPTMETSEETVRRLEKENASLRKQVDSLEMDRAILKKAAAFFAKESE